MRIRWRKEMRERKEETLRDARGSWAIGMDGEK